MLDVAVVGKANIDYLVRGPRLPVPGQSVNGDVFQEAAGGKGANQAVGAARLGARVSLVARVGRDARGDAVLAALRDEGVGTRQVTRDPEEPTGIALCQVGASGEKQILSAAGANARLTAAFVRDAADVLRSARVVLCQLGVPLEAVMEAVRIGRAAGARVVLDPGPPAPLPDELIACLDLIRPNTSEAQVLTGIRVCDRDSARAAGRELLRRGARAAAVQAGEHGSRRPCWERRHPCPSATQSSPCSDNRRLLSASLSSWSRTLRPSRCGATMSGCARWSLGSDCARRWRFPAPCGSWPQPGCARGTRTRAKRRSA